MCLEHCLLDHFKLCRRLGCGSYAEAYEVERRADGRHYALKQTVLKQLPWHVRADVVNEVRLLASLRHPYIVRFYEAFVEQGSLNVVMELMPGGDLAACIRRVRAAGQVFSEDFIWSVLLQVGDALRHLHSLHIMHRDVKPNNVLLSSDGHVVKLVDLGIAKLMRDDLTRTIIGTPHYMSPEVWQRLPYSLSGDVWGLGCLLYELAALQAPFGGNNLRELHAKVLMGRVERIPEHYSEELWQLIRSMLSSQPQERPGMEALMSHPSVAGRAHLLPPEAAAIREAVGEEPHLAPSLLDTIQVPDDLEELNLQLPPAAYDAGHGAVDYLRAKLRRQRPGGGGYMGEAGAPDLALLPLPGCDTQQGPASLWGEEEEKGKGSPKSNTYQVSVVAGELASLALHSPPTHDILARPAACPSTAAASPGTPAAVAAPRFPPAASPTAAAPAPAAGSTAAAAPACHRGKLHPRFAALVKRDLGPEAAARHVHTPASYLLACERRTASEAPAGAGQPPTSAAPPGPGRSSPDSALQQAAAECSPANHCAGEEQSTQGTARRTRVFLPALLSLSQQASAARLSLGALCGEVSSHSIVGGPSAAFANDWASEPSIHVAGLPSGAVGMEQAGDGASRRASVPSGDKQAKRRRRSWLSKLLWTCT